MSADQSTSTARDETPNRTYRATGYGRLAAPTFASADVAGARVRLVVPVEQVVAVDARSRPVSRTSVTVTGGTTDVQRVADRTFELLREKFDLGGEYRLQVRTPPGPRRPDHLEAAAVACIDALAKTDELALSPDARGALVAQVVPAALGLAHGCPGIVDAAGRATHRLPEHGRVLIVVATPPEFHEEEPAGKLLTPDDECAEPVHFAAWLNACAGGGTSEVHDLVSSLTQGSWGVLGGHTATSPVGVILPGGRNQLLVAQQVTAKLQTALSTLAETPAQAWRVTSVQTAAHSAAA